MIVSSPLYLILLLGLVVLASSLKAGAPRAALILFCSYAYYLTFPIAFFPILVYVVAVAYCGGLLIERLEGSRLKSWGVGAAIVLCFAPLLIYKYILPLASTSHRVVGIDWQLTTQTFLIPIGLSFYTFTAVGYLADVALGLVPVERAATRVALFCGFFPSVTSGPIPRAAHVLPQMDFKREFTAERGMRATTEILFGVVMKVWIADTLGVTSSAVFNDIGGSSALEQLVATLIFSFQLYADFAGYSLIAIGSARLLGIDLPDNFRQPYLADSITEFWRRWHVSLFTWLRDYVFTPLRVRWRHWPQLGTSSAIFITLLLMGIWHGAGWGYVVFGTVHGLLLIASQLTLPRRNLFLARLRIPASVVYITRVPITFLIVSLSFILIRASDLDQASRIYRNIFNRRLLSELSDLFAQVHDSALAFRHISLAQNWLDLALVSILVGGDLVARRDNFSFLQLPAPLRAACYAICIFVVFVHGVSDNATKQFLYFQF